MHVRISNKGRALLNNKVLAHKVAVTILNGKKELEEGKSVMIKGENFSVKLATTIKDTKITEKESK